MEFIERSNANAIPTTTPDFTAAFHKTRLVLFDQVFNIVYAFEKEFS